MLLTEAATLEAVKTITATSIKETIESTTGLMAWLFKKLRAQRRSRNGISKCIKDIRNKMLLYFPSNPGNKLDLLDNFAPLTVYCGTQKIEDNSYAAFTGHKHLVLQGFPGSGKSTLLNYIYLDYVLKYLKTKSIIPVYLNGNNLKTEQLDTLVLKHISATCNCSSEDLKLLDRRFPVVLFIDDINALSNEEQESLLNQIYTFSSIASYEHIICASRPGSILTKRTPGGLEPFFGYQISSLTDKGREKIFLGVEKSLGADWNKTRPSFELEYNDCLEQLKKNDLMINFETPLFLSLSYAAFIESKKPDTKNSYSLFYTGLDSALTKDMKPDVRKHLLEFMWNWQQYNNCSAMHIDADIKHTATLSKYLDKLSAFESSGIISIENKPTADNEIKCLHPLIGEYYAASYLAKRPPSSARTLYTALRRDWLNCSSVLLFLAELDKANFNKHFLRWDLSKLWKKLVNKSKPITKPKVDTINRKLLKEFNVQCNYDKSEFYNPALNSSELYGWWARRYRWYQPYAFHKSLLETIMQNEAFVKLRDMEEHPASVTFKELDSWGCIKKAEFRQIAADFTEQAWNATENLLNQMASV